MLDPVATLRRQQMPPDEIRAILTADDPTVVRRLFELHRERMEEWLEEQRRLVARIERSLAGEGQRRLGRVDRRTVRPARHFATCRA